MEKCKVYHDTGTSGLKAPDGSKWIEYWEKQTGLEIPEICPCCGKETKENEFVGAHVFKYIEYALAGKRQKYITPTCQYCNDKYKYSKALEKVFDVLEERLLPV